MSKETKFTKGGWKIVKSVAFDNELGNVGETTMISIGSRISPICHHGIQGKCFDYDEQEANAHLIKTATKLYEMLESLRENVDMSDQEHDNVTSLLAEARGE